MGALSAAERWRLKRLAPRLFNALWLLCLGCHLATSVSGPPSPQPQP